MELLKNLEWRYATKKFDPLKKVSEEHIKLLKQAIRLSASSYGLQLYKVLVISDRRLRERLQSASWGQNQVTEASHLFVFCHYTETRPEYIDAYIRLTAETRKLDVKDLNGYGDSIKTKISEKSAEEKTAWLQCQPYIALGNLLAACAELKIDACPMEGFEREQYDEILSLDKQGLSAVALAAVGYRHSDDTSQNLPKVRKPDEVLFAMNLVRYKHTYKIKDSARSIGTTFHADMVNYAQDDTEYEGYYAAPQGAVRGQVLVIHDWNGLDEYEIKRADMLAEMGYAAFAVDLFGKGNRPDTPEAKKTEVARLYDDRETMRKRIVAGLGELRALTGQASTAVMGYCFGGAAALELARSGSDSDIVGYATFHGGLQTPEDQSYSGDVPPILVMHGGADSSITMGDVSDLSEQLEEAGVDYQIEVYSGAQHGFTVLGSDRYNENADQKSWASFSKFLSERFD